MNIVMEYLQNKQVTSIIFLKRAIIKVNLIIKRQSSEENFWEIDEYHKFINSVEDEYKRDIYEFMFLTGLRIGEFCALQ